MTLSFAAFDVETANPTHGSICAIGVTVVRDGTAATTRSMLCRPPAAVDSFSPHNMRIHGIKPGVDAAAAAGVALGFARLAGARTLVELARANGAHLTRLANR